MSSFIPMNMGIAYTLLFNPKIPLLSRVFPSVTNTPETRIMFWNLYNRSYCVALDWFNRNPSADIEEKYKKAFGNSKDDKDHKLDFYLQNQQDVKSLYFKSFCMATTAAFALAGLGKWMTNKFMSYNSSISAKVFGRYLSPALALSGGHICDLWCMRNQEIKHGITLKYEDDTDVVDKDGIAMRSKIAGQLAVFQVGLQRILNANIVLITPSIGMAILEKLKTSSHFLQTSPRGRLFCELGFCFVALVAALPLTQAISPKIGQIDCNKLEPMFHKKNSDGTNVKYTFDRGL